MNQHELTRRIVNAWKAKAAVAAICAGVTLAAHANYDWQGTTGEWNGSVANWWDGSALVPWANGSYAYLPVAGAGIVTDIVVDAGGVTASTYEQQAGSSYTLSGGPVATTVFSVNGGSDGSNPSSLTISNAVSASDTFYFRGLVTIADGGSLTVNTYSPMTTGSVGVDTAKVVVLEGGVLEITNLAGTVGSNYSTLYVDGGTVKHAQTDYNKNTSFSKSHIKVGPKGMRVTESRAGQMSFLPKPVESGGETDGGLWVDYHTGYYLLYGSNSYKGRLHLMPSGGQVGVQADSNLGAETSTPTNSIIYEGDGTTQTGPVLVSHSQSSVTLGANRDILIGDNVKARFSTYSASSRLVLRGAIDCVDRTNGVLQIGGYSTGPVVIETSGGRTNHLGRLIVTQPLIIGNGTTLVENTKGISRETGGHAEDWGVNDGAVMNIRDSGHLMVTGGVLKATGSRNLCISANMTVSDGGVVDLTGHEVLHGYNGPAITTVRGGGKLLVSTIRMAGDNSKYYSDPTKSVMNVETGGVLRVTAKMHVTDANKRATLSFNGGMLEWGNSSSSFFSGTGTYQDTSRVGLLVYVKEGGMVVSNNSTLYIDQPIQFGAAADGGITKWGGGELALSHPTNTFNGPIRVMQGTFATFGARINPINTNCTVCVNANTSFRANTSYHTFARIEGSGSFTQNTDHNFTVWQAIAPGMGTNSLGTLTVSGGPVNILDGVALEIDLDAEGHSDCFKCSGELDLSKMTLQVNDVTKLGKNKKYVIASNLTDVTGEFKSTNLPPGWGTRYYAASKELKIVPLNGTTLIVR